MSGHQDAILIEGENYNTLNTFACKSEDTDSKNDSRFLKWIVFHVKATCMHKQKHIQFLKYMLRLMLFLLLFGMSAMIGKIVTMVFVVPRVNVNVPPSPDVLLDSFQHPLPQAFKASEWITLTLVSMLIIISLFHTKERSYILPRYLFISASLINLRTLCISITTFSVPSRELSEKCSNLQQLSTEVLWWKSINIFEFSETCGDYVFSGHATALVVTAWFVWYYGRSLSFLTSKHILKKFMNFILCSIVIIGLLCILLAKEHYTVDVVLGAVISIMGCALFHSILENFRNQLKTHDNKERKLGLDDTCNISSFHYLWFLTFDSANNNETISSAGNV